MIRPVQTSNMQPMEILLYLYLLILAQFSTSQTICYTETESKQQVCEWYTVHILQISRWHVYAERTLMWQLNKKVVLE